MQVVVAKDFLELPVELVENLLFHGVINIRIRGWFIDSFFPLY